MLITPTAEEIVAGVVTDHCAPLSLEVLEELGYADRKVTLEAHVRRFPTGVMRGVLCGVEDVLRIIGDRHIEVVALPSCSFFYEREPVLFLTGSARDVAVIRPAITGALTFASSVVTRTAEFIEAARDIPVYFFGSRKLHPAHVLQYLECAYLGGMEVNASPLWRKFVPDARLEDCQEHFANLVADTVDESWLAFLNLPASSGAQFIVLDNIADPIWELRRAVTLFGQRLGGVLLDMDSTRRGDVVAILSELAWHLGLLGRPDIKLCLTGGVTPDLIRATRSLVSSYGVGISAIHSDWFDFAVQVVAVEDQPRSKIGVRPGRKHLFVCSQCQKRVLAFRADPESCCGSELKPLLAPISLAGMSDLATLRSTLRANLLR